MSDGTVRKLIETVIQEHIDSARPTDWSDEVKGFVDRTYKAGGEDAMEILFNTFQGLEDLLEQALKSKGQVVWGSASSIQNHLGERELTDNERNN